MTGEGATPHGANGQESLASVLATRTIPVHLKDFESETRCAVCLGIVKDCRLVSGCMHRFCSECIEKWLRVASEPACPQCRMQMQSRRDCKRDSRFNRLMQQLYGDLHGSEAQKESALEDPLVAKGRELGRQLASALEAQRAKRAMPPGLPGPDDADRAARAAASPAPAAAPAGKSAGPPGKAAAPQQAKRKVRAESPAPKQDSGSAGPSSGKAPESRAGKEAKAGKQPAAKRARKNERSSTNIAAETPIEPTEFEAMEQAALLKSKAEEMQRQEAQHIDSVIQVIVSLPAPDKADDAQDPQTMHILAPSSITAAQLLEAIKQREPAWSSYTGGLQVLSALKKNRTPEKGTEKRLQPDKALGLVFQRLKHHKEALHLELCRP